MGGHPAVGGRLRHALPTAVDNRPLDVDGEHVTGEDRSDEARGVQRREAQVAAALRRGGQCGAVHTFDDTHPREDREPRIVPREDEFRLLDADLGAGARGRVVAAGPAGRTT